MAKTRQRQAVEEQPEAKAEKVERITRSAAANQVVAGIDGATTLSELAQEADQLFVDGGGESKTAGRLAAATYYVRRALETAEAVGVLKLVRPTDILVERVKGSNRSK